MKIVTKEESAELLERPFEERREEMMRVKEIVADIQTDISKSSETLKNPPIHQIPTFCMVYGGLSLGKLSAARRPAGRE